jgi:hypothetical protein
MSMCENPTAHITKTPRRAANTAAAKVSDRARVRGPIARREPMMCVCIIASVARVISIPFTRCGQASPEPELPAKDQFDDLRGSPAQLQLGPTTG